MERVVDYLIIGAGIAGTVLERYLRGEDVVIVDPSPGGYRVGESTIPSFFNGDLLRAEALPYITSLPSYTPKHGTTFIGLESVAAFPLWSNDRPLAMHIARHELDSTLHSALRTSIVGERVESVDVANKLVRTERTTFRVRRQIIDCSGNAMVVARALDEVEELFPAYARWGYFDVTEVRPERFLDDIRASGRAYTEYDVATSRVIGAERAEAWDPSHSTLLSTLGEGLWSWQIPLYGRRLLSFGVVSRNGPVDEAAFEEIALKTHSPIYAIKPRRPSRSDPLSRTHVRNRFARVSRRVATMNYIKLADAAIFADPIYSTGTGFAAMSAVHLAGLLVDGGWTEAKRRAYQARYEQILEVMLGAIDVWYHSDLLHRDDASARAVSDALRGTLFQRAFARSYHDVVLGSELTDRVGPWEDIPR